MGKQWIIDKGERRQIETKEGDIYKDANKWCLVAPRGIDTFRTKRAAKETRRAMMPEYSQ